MLPSTKVTYSEVTYLNIDGNINYFKQMNSKHNGMQNTKESFVSYVINCMDNMGWWQQQKFSITASRFWKDDASNMYVFLIDKASVGL
jgi:hypothetical protein